MPTTPRPAERSTTLRAASMGRTLAYHASWVVALSPIGALAGQIAQKAAQRADGSDVWWILGGLGGAGLGMLLASVTRSATVLHRVFRIAGPVLLVVGLAIATWMFVQAAGSRGTGPFAGLGEFVLGLGGSLLALLGGAAWLAGCTSPRRRIPQEPAYSGDDCGDTRA